MRRFLLISLSILGLLAVFSSPSGASNIPTSPTVTANYNHIDKANPLGGAPIGRTSAGAVPIKSPVDAVPKSVYSKIVPPTVARPWGAEKYGILDANTAQDYLCTSAFNAESSSGAPYLVVAGHCANKNSPPLGAYYYPFTTTRTPIGPSARFNYDSTGDHGAIREYTQYDNDPSQWRGSDGVPRTIAAIGNPILNETACMVLGNSNVTICGTVIDDNTCSPFTGDAPGTTHCNLAVLQSPVGPCVIGGDSGSPVIVGHDGVGIIAAGGNFSGHCLVWFDRAGSTFQSYQLFPA